VAFERLAAADVSFPETVRRVAVASRVPEVEPASQPGIISTWMEGDGPVAAESLAEDIASTRYFEEVVLADSLPADTAEWATALGADLLVSLERVVLHARPTVVFDDEAPFPVDGVEVVITPVVRVYLPGRSHALFTLAPSDSLTWSSLVQPTDSLVRHEASAYAGSIPLRQLLPHWQEISRHYYDGATVDLRDAGVSVRENDWAQAATLWQRVYAQKKGKLRRLAAYNLALYHEMQDELSEALTWIDRALEGAKEGSEERTQAEAYRQRLQERNHELGKLRAQMQRFE
jgi:hypothetical protein